ncbi:MAG TPA: alkaline phosphatase family protein [Terriglobia bacterium]|nr:alkaline phosphatase family protein [Terriglobia bacterium]
MKFTMERELLVPSRSGHSRRLDIFVLIDALGWKFLEGREFLSDLLAYRQPLRTVLGFSSGAIPAILTGRSPAENGHWNLFYYDPDGSPFRWLRYFRFLPGRFLDHRVTRKLLKEMGRHALGMGRNFECCVSPRLLPWFNFIERRNIYSPGGIAGAKSVFDLLLEKGIPHRVYTYHQWSDEEILARALRDVKESDARFFFVYLCEMDLLLHNQWTNPAPLEQRLNLYAGRLRQLFQAARLIDPDATFTVTSDHGMTPVRGQYDLVRDVAELGLKLPEDYLVVYDSTMARFWFFSDRARTQIVKMLDSLKCGRVLADEELRELGLFFADRRYGEAIFLLHPGWLIAKSDFNGPGWVPAGMHGYHPDDPYSDAIFLSNRRPSSAVRTIADVYGVMGEAVDSTEL